MTPIPSITLFMVVAMATVVYQTNGQPFPSTANNNNNNDEPLAVPAASSTEAPPPVPTTPTPGDSDSDGDGPIPIEVEKRSLLNGNLGTMIMLNSLLRNGNTNTAGATNTQGLTNAILLSSILNKNGNNGRGGRGGGSSSSSLTNAILLQNMFRNTNTATNTATATNTNANSNALRNMVLVGALMNKGSGNYRNGLGNVGTLLLANNLINRNTNTNTQYIPPITITG